ncbi:hypothetical protein B9Z19DRAFT_1126063 [Tuber borchii]|uniref:Uncharacterized protein n=1 Tax=Tuber borchii TaxID=42251 RepID=A0A2T6ZTK0_TUBBO|nr:hypothetical protein B9Z19DRAFT_1126063 [Tuber borchii]
MCKDPKTGEIFRADHIIEEIPEARLKCDKEARGATVLEKEDADKKKRKKKLKDTQANYQIDNYSGEALGKLIVDHGITSPTTGSQLELFLT